MRRERPATEKWRSWWFLRYPYGASSVQGLVLTEAEAPCSCRSFDDTFEVGPCLKIASPSSPSRSLFPAEAISLCSANSPLLFRTIIIESVASVGQAYPPRQSPLAVPHVPLGISTTASSRLVLEYPFLHC